MVDRSYTAKCLAKAIAYAECGKEAEADAWARQLLIALGRAGILKPLAQCHAEGRAITAIEMVG